MNDVERLLEEHGLRARIEPADANPTMPDPPAEATHWSVLVEGGAAPVAWHVSVLREGGDPSPPSLTEAVGFLRADLEGLAGTGDPEAWIAGLSDGSTDPEAWGGALHALRGLSDEVRGNLPAAVAAAFGTRPEAVAVPMPAF